MGDERFGGRAITGGLWSLLQTLSGRVASLATFVVLARLVEPSAFGLVALAAVVVAFVQILVEMGFGEAIVQRRHLEPGHLDTVFWISLVSAAAVSAVVSALSVPISALFDEPDLAPILVVLSLLLPLNALSVVPNALLRRRLAFRALAVRGVVSGLLASIVGIAMGLAGAGAWALVGQQVAFYVAGVITLNLAAHWRPGLGMTRRHFDDLFAYSRNVFGTSVLIFFERRADDLLIGAFLGSLALGFYSVGYRIVSIGTDVITASMQRVTVPVFARIQHDAQRVSEAFLRITRISTLVAFSVFGVLAVVATPLLVVVFGAEWTPSAPVMQWLCIGAAANSLSYFNGAVFLGLGRADLRMRVFAVNACLQVIGFAIAAQFGIAAVAASYAVVTTLMLPIEVAVVRRLIPLDLGAYLGQVAASAGIAAATAGVAWLVRDHLDGRAEVLQLVGACAAAALAFTGLVALCARSLITEVAHRVAPGRFPGLAGPA